ncbi:Threonine dehydratase biosynthetic, chloroplastic, partial [Trachymyrmex cornetzi]
LLNSSGFNIYLKKELYQFTDSIKARGVIYSLLHLSEVQRCRGVITISSGSFAFILCYYADKYRIPVTVVLPTTTIDEKIMMCQSYPLSRVLVKGNNFLEAHRTALDIAMREDLFYFDGNDHPNMIIGQATLGIEIMKQQSNVDVVLLPTTIEGCGLTTAIAIAIKGCNSKITVIEVRGTSSDLFHAVKKQTDSSKELNIPTKEYIACPLRNMPHCVIDRFISVTPELIDSASIHLHKSESYYDCYGAIALAAILSGQLNDLQGKRKIGVHVYFKKELNQHMNSIQARGVIYTLLQLTDEQKRNGVITISTGYFAQTLCYFGQKFKIPVTVVMLKLTAQEIVDKCQYLGATVIVRGDNIVEVHNIALQIARRKCLCYLDGNDHPNMIIGQATLGLEIFEQLDFGKTIDAVILPTTVDGCGVTATIAMAIRKSNSNIKIIEVQTTVQDLLTNNVRQKCHKLNIPEQNLYVGYSHNLFQDIRLYLFDRLVLVSETLIRKAANFLLATENFNDYYAAIALAGILTGNLHDLIKEKR